MPALERPGRIWRVAFPLSALCLLTLASLGGCGTLAGDSAAHVRDGKQYGVVKGAFHSRWWNFYERGRSFADGGFWQEAEKDLRHALALRGNDQLWPRTYGLHFLPEYFPHRELGAVLYHEGRVDEAVSELETSIGQQFSARAAFLLNESRRELAAQRKCDGIAPEIDLALPGVPAASASLKVTGSAHDSGFVSRVTVNGLPCSVPVSAASVNFEREIPLSSGLNRIVVEAGDLSGNKSSIVREVLCDIDGPAVSFDQPLRLPGRVTGVLFDASGIRQLTIDGKPASLAAENNTTQIFSVNCSNLDTKKPLCYEASDVLGNIAKGVVPVDVLVLSRQTDPVCFASFSPTPQSLSPTLCGMFEAGQLIAVFRTTAAATPQSPLSAKFLNVVEGRKYLMEEIAVAVEIEASQPVTKAVLNGSPLPVVPGRNLQRLTRRVPLKPGLNTLELAVESQDGGSSASTVTIERQLSNVEQTPGRLSVAILGNVWKGNSPLLEHEAAFITDEFTGEFSRRERFNLTDRALLPEILNEQKLNEMLGSHDQRLAIGKLLPAEIMIVGRVRRDADSMEIVAEAISSETSEFVARADVAGKADNLDQLRELVDMLALKVTQEFPRVQGQIALVKGSEQFVSNLNAGQNVRGSMRLVVFRYGAEILDPATKESLGKDTLIVGDALVETVDDKKSVAHRISARDSRGAPLAIEVGDYVVVK